MDGIFNVIRNRFVKENFSNNELIQLEKEIWFAINISDEEADKIEDSELVIRYMNVRNDVLNHKKVLRLEEIHKSLVESFFNTVFVDLIDGIKYKETAIDIARKIIIENLDLIKSDKYEKHHDSFLPMKVIDEYDEKTSSLNRDFLWYKHRITKLHILTVIYVLSCGEFNNISKINYRKKLELLLSFYCIIPEVILGLSLGIGLVIKKRGFVTFDCINELSERVHSTNPVTLYTLLFIASTCINIFIVKLINSFL